MADTAVNVAGTILKKIGPLVEDHIKLTWGLKEELKKLDFLVALINAIQEEYRGNEDHINTVDRVWLNNLQNIMKEMITVLEYFERRADHNNRDHNTNNNDDDDKPSSDDDNINNNQQTIIINNKQKKELGEEEGCLTPIFSYFLSHPNPIVWFRDGVMARKITTIRKRLLDNLDDKKMLEFHPAIRNKQAAAPSSSPNDPTIIAPSARAWTVASDYIVIIQINYLPEKEKLPPLHNLPHLEQLTLEYLTLEYIYEGNSPSGKLFPKLRKVWIRYCPNLKGWWQLPKTEKDDESSCSIIIPQFPCLEHLDIREFKDLIWFPFFPNLFSTLYMVNGSVLHFERTRNILIANASIYFKIQYLWLSNLPDLEFLDIELFPNLVSLYVYDCDKFKVWGNKGDEEETITGKLSSSVTKLELQNCPRLKCLPEGMCLLDFYTTFYISGCRKLKEKYADKTDPNWPSQIHQSYLTVDW